MFTGKMETVQETGSVQSSMVKRFDILSPKVSKFNAKK